MKTISIAIMGLGTVGGGAYDILKNNRELISRTQGYEIKVKRVLDRSIEHVEKRTGEKNIGTTSLDDIISDPEIKLVIETMGGIEPAKTFIKKILLSGKSVVSANKELISKSWSELEEAAKQGGAGFYFEASCVGGVPIIRTLTESVQGDNILELMGIVNGTTNYILTKMSENDSSYDDALKGAQKIGFAEADPTSDVEGHDAMYKLSILLSLAFHTCIPFTSIYREGITKISKSDIMSGKELGYTIKLVAMGRKNGNEIEARVHPAFVPLNHPLAAVRNEFNAVFLKGDYVDNIMLYGRGAGAKPTGSAIVSDVITCINADGKYKYTDFDNNGKVNPPVKIMSDFNSKYYVALSVADRPGVLARVTDIFGKLNISIDTVMQRGADGQTAHIIFLTHLTSEQAVQNALVKIKELKEVNTVDSLIRVL